MTWLEPTVADISGLIGSVRTIGHRPKKERRRVGARMWYAKNREKLRAYHRAYYHAKRKPKGVRFSFDPVKQRAAARARYWANVEQERALARARYAANRERYAAASRERMRRKAA